MAAVSRLPQIRSAASQSIVSAWTTASSQMRLGGRRIDHSLTFWRNNSL
jgi:hypothetical protein